MIYLYKKKYFKINYHFNFNIISINVFNCMEKLIFIYLFKSEIN